MSETATPHPRLLVNAISAKAATDPDSPWLLYANSSSWEQEGGYRTITWKQFAHAVDKAAFWLDANLPRVGQTSQTFAYLGPNDARYYILIAAAAKSKRRFFIPDGRMTPEGLASILGEIQCTTLICARETLNTSPGQKLLVFPPLEEIVLEDCKSSATYPYNKTWEEAKDEITCIIHTSGTTGTPKPIYLRNGYMSAFDSWSTIISRHHPRKVTYRHFVNARSLNLCSPQWLAGFAFSLNSAVFINTTTIMPPPSLSPLSPESIMRICAHTGASSIITPPSLIESFSGNERTFDFLKSLEYICYLGAALDHEVGDKLAPHTNLFPVIGSTERGGQLSFESEDREMWKSYDFVPEMGARFEEVGDDMYELFNDRTKESDLFQCGFYTFPERKSLNTDELYSPVVDKYGSKRWISRGRKDDLVKLSWLAKFHASHIEDTIARHPLVSAVLIGGEGRDVPYIIIEPKDHNLVKNSDQFVDDVYNTSIYAINEKDNDEIRIPRETVMLADPALPFKRTVKMTIMRKETEKMYEHYIEALYSH